MGQVEACALAHAAAPVRFSTLTPEAASAFVGRPQPQSQAPGCQRPASTKLTKDVSSLEDSARRDLNLEFSNGYCCAGGRELLSTYGVCGSPACNDRAEGEASALGGWFGGPTLAQENPAAPGVCFPM